MTIARINIEETVNTNPPGGPVVSEATLSVILEEQDEATVDDIFSNEFAATGIEKIQSSLSITEEVKETKSVSHEEDASTADPLTHFSNTFFGPKPKALERLDVPSFSIMENHDLTSTPKMR